MNIIEAIKSGKRFKRRSHFDYWPKPNGNSHTFNLEELLADDWEIESKPVMITREKLEEAWAKSFGWNEPYGALSLKCLAEELGL